MSSDDKVLDGVGRTIMVVSGKGGVGKSTVATQLALSFKRSGLKVGLLDVDLCGPSVPRMLNLESHEVHQCDAGWVPVYTDSSQTLGVMSIGFLLQSRNNAVVWRGPKKNAMIKQFLTDVAWQERDILVIDTPPGTSDEHITLMEALRESGVRVDGAVVVTTPQALSVADVRRQLTFCKRAGLKVLGVVENMSGYVCPHCDECTDIFSKGGGELLADYAKVPFLGRVPIEPNLALCTDKGEDFVEAFAQSKAAERFLEITQVLMAKEP